MALIELRGIERSFRNDDSIVDALSDISLDVDAGEFVCITGPSGSGKSTLLNILACLDRATDGVYRFADVAVDFGNADGLARLRRDLIGLASQEPNLLQTATALRNVGLPAVYSGIGYVETKRRAQKLLDSFGLGDKLRHCPRELSGGENQRIAMARALVNRPRLILADEPTAALDPAQSEAFSTMLANLAARGHAVVVVSHDVAITTRAGRRIELQDGRLVADTAIHEVAPETTNGLMPDESGDSTPLSRLLAMLRESLRSLCESPTRAAACVFSVALGVGSVVVILGLAEGTERTIRELLENREINVNAFGSLEDAPIQLSVSDAHAIQTELPSVRAIELWTRGNFKVQSEGLSQDGVVEAQTAPRPIVNDGEEWPLKAGTFLTADDHKRRAQVALLGPSLRKSLFEDDADPVGKYVQIGGVPFLVKGVLGEYPLPAGFDIPDEIKENMRFQLGQVVYVPFATALDVLDQGSATASSLSFAAIDMIVADAALVEKVASELRDLLIRRHGREGFNIEIPAKQRANTLGGLWSRPLAFLSGVAGVALLACGAGVTVIMALWVDARRDEIGIRVALGARGRDIVNQVLTEALMAAALGGLLGVLGGILIGPAVASVITPTGLPQPPLAFATWTFAAALGCALGMGLAAAAIAARRATRLDPVNALTA